MKITWPFGRKNRYVFPVVPVEPPTPRPSMKDQPWPESTDWDVCAAYCHDNIEPLEDGATIISEAQIPLLLKKNGQWYFVVGESKYTHVNYVQLLSILAYSMTAGKRWSIF